MGRDYRPFANYKKTDLFGVDELPDHWGVEPIKYNSYVKGRIGWQNLRSEEFTEEGPYLVTGMHFRDGGVDWDSCYHISEERYEVAPEIQLQVDDVLITKDGSIGKLAHIQALPDKASLNSHLLVIRPLRKRYIPRFLFYLLSSPVFRSHIDLRQSGTTFFGITQEAVVQFPLILPALCEQGQIAKFLDRETAKIDRLIEKQEELIALLQEKRQAVISHAVTKGLNPDAPMKDSGIEWLGEVPEHWKSGPVKFFGRVIDCKHITAEFSDQGYPLASIGEVRGKYVDLSDAKRTSKRFYLQLIEGDREPSPGDVILTRNATVGECSLVPESDEKFAMGQDVCLIRFGDELRPEFALKVLKSDVILQQIDLAMIGSTFKRINVDQIRNFTVPIPPIDEQDSVAEELTRIEEKYEKLINSAEDACELFKERRTALISAAVTGKIDVRDWNSASNN